MYVLPHPATSSGTQCFVSLSTMQTVPSCPKTEAELSRAKERKKCEHLANIQQCTKPEHFTYHCVLNFWNTEYKEVCAPEFFSQGFCLFFDEEGAILQENYHMDCTRYTNPCKSRFLSSDLLQYSQCNEIVRQSKRLMNMTDTTKRLLNKVDNKDDNRIIFIYTTFIGIAVLLVFNVFGCVRYIIDMRDKKNRTVNRTVEYIPLRMTRQDQPLTSNVIPTEDGNGHD